MKEEKRNIKHCKHGHPIGEDAIVLLGHTVGVCPCGHKYLVSEMPACYTKDKRNALKERFHHYQFLSPLMCRRCHRFLTGIDIVCKPMDLLEEDWKKMLLEELDQFKEEKKVDEPIQSKDNQPASN